MKLTEREIVELQIMLERQMDKCFEEEQFYKTFQSKHSESNRDYYRKQYFHYREILEKLKEEFRELKEGEKNE